MHGQCRQVDTISLYYCLFLFLISNLFSHSLFGCSSLCSVVAGSRDGLSLASTSEDDTATVTSHLTTTAATNPCTMPRARVVLAPPCAEWLPGVEVITGHDHGHIYLWKLHVAPRNKASSLLPTLSSSSTSTLDLNPTEVNHDNDKETTTNILGHHRQLLAFPLPGPQLISTTNHSKATKSSTSSSHHNHHHQSNPNPHRASITVLRVLSINPTRTKEFADRSFHLTSGMEPHNTLYPNPSHNLYSIALSDLHRCSLYFNHPQLPIPAIRPNGSIGR